MEPPDLIQDVRKISLNYAAFLLDMLQERVPLQLTALPSSGRGKRTQTRLPEVPRAAMRVCMLDALIPYRIQTPSADINRALQAAMPSHANVM